MSRCRNACAAICALALAALAPAPAGAAMALRPGMTSESPPPAPPSAPAAPTPPVAPAAPAAALSPPPTPAAPKPGQLVPPKKPELVGTVIYAKGARIVAEIQGGATAKERFRVFDTASRVRGEAVALKALDEATCLLEPVGGASIAAGDRLARERE